MSATLDFEQLDAELRALASGDTRFRWWNPRVLVTPALRHLAERAELFWLIDAIASYYGSAEMRAAIRADERLASLQFWTLAVANGTATLTMVADSGEEPAITQAIAFTDCPLDEVRIWSGFDGKHWTLYLPMEH